MQRANLSSRTSVTELAWQQEGGTTPWQGQYIPTSKTYAQTGKRSQLQSAWASKTKSHQKKMEVVAWWWAVWWWRGDTKHKNTMNHDYRTCCFWRHKWRSNQLMTSSFPVDKQICDARVSDVNTHITDEQNSSLLPIDSYWCSQLCAQGSRYRHTITDRYRQLHFFTGNYWHSYTIYRGFFIDTEFRELLIYTSYTILRTDLTMTHAALWA